jgi:hypothetical protein
VAPQDQRDSCSVATLISWRLLHFNFDAADPACDKIVDGGADNTEDEPIKP